MSRIHRRCFDSLLSDHPATPELFVRVRQEPDEDEEEDEDDGKEEEKDDEDEDTTDAGYSE